MHDSLLAGFPCQPFSICGDMNGFDDTRGTLFFDIARILKAKQPKAFVLENVKQLKGHNQGQTLRRIMVKNILRPMIMLIFMFSMPLISVFPKNESASLLSVLENRFSFFGPKAKHL